MNAIKKFLVMAISGLAFTGCFDMTEHPYTLLDASNYFTDENSVKQVVAHIYAQEQSDLSELYWYAQELSADQITWRSWNGGSWGWDSGDKFVLSTHTWNPSSNYVNRIWSGAWTAIGLCNNFITDLESISASSLGMSEVQKQAYIDEVRTFRVYCFYNVFEVFGSVIPLSTTTDTSVLPVSAMDGMTFEEGNAKVCQWMIDELDLALESLAINGSVNRCNQAMNRMLKMRILLNSEIFTGVARFDECKALAKDIIDGKYGNYAIAENYKDIYSANNNTDCKEIVFAFSSDVVYNKRSTNMRNGPFMNYVFAAHFNTKEEHAGWNCCCLTPSFDNSSNFYNQCVSFDANGTASVVQNMYDKELAKCFLDGYGDKLGAVMERFDPADIRLVTPYNDAAGNWGGHFMKGVMYSDFGNGELQMADADRDGQPLVYVDQVGNFQGKGEHPLQVVENPRWGETNSGIRMAKYPYYNIDAPYNFCDPDVVEFRLAEVYYTYAECLLREGNSTEAKNWVNEVRKRYFSAADWTVAKDRAPRGFDAAFDEDRMLSEWGLEFLDEGHRRRTDLRRFDKFTQGQWWFFGRATETGYDLPDKRHRRYEWFPVPERALAANPGLTQNPEYM